MHCGLAFYVCVIIKIRFVICHCSGIVEAYQVPYYECVSNDPSFDEMKEVVCIGMRRPSIPLHWADDEVDILL